MLSVDTITTETFFYGEPVLHFNFDKINYKRLNDVIIKRFVCAIQ